MPNEPAPLAGHLRCGVRRRGLAAATEALGCRVTGVQVLYCWMTASGISHAQRWTVMSAEILKQTRFPGAPGGSAWLALSLSEEALAGSATVASAITIEGWRLDELCRE